MIFPTSIYFLHLSFYGDYFPGLLGGWTERPGHEWIRKARDELGIQIQQCCHYTAMGMLSGGNTYPRAQRKSGSVACFIHVFRIYYQTIVRHQNKVEFIGTRIFNREWKYAVSPTLNISRSQLYHSEFSLLAAMPSVFILSASFFLSICLSPVSNAGVAMAARREARLLLSPTVSRSWPITLCQCP